MLQKLVLGVAASLLMAVPAIAAEATPEQVTVTADREIVCKSVTHSGSLIAAQKLCLSRAQWDTERRRAQANLVQVQDKGLFVNSVMGRPGG